MAQFSLSSILSGSRTTKTILIGFAAVICIIVFASPALSTGGKRYIGQFDGSEPKTDTYDCGSDYLYEVIGPVQVSVTGSYAYGDISISYDVDMTLAIYQGSFNPANPANNKVGAFDDNDGATLNSGVDYYLVVQPLCSDTLGEWQFALAGPGDITDGVSGGFYFGQFDGSEPKTDAYGCGGDYAYDIIGPIQVPSTETYAYVDLSISYDVDMTLTIYQGSFNPANPANNRVNTHDDDGPFTLISGPHYYLVVQPLCYDAIGEWGFALVGESGALPGPAAPIPTLSQFGVACLCLLLAGSALWLIRRRKGSS